MRGDGTMRSSITQFAIRTVVGIVIAFVGTTAIGMVVANSAAERAWTITHEAIVKPFRSLAGTSEFQLREHQQLRRVFLDH